MKMTNSSIKLSHPIIVRANKLGDEHEVYLEQFVTRANTELYRLLAEIMSVYEDLAACSIQERVVKQMRVILKEKYGIKTQANSKLASLVVRYVTRSNRKTAHIYSKVIETAKELGVKSTGLAEFIKQKGGIDKVRKVVNSAEVARVENLKSAAISKLKNALPRRQPLGQLSIHSNTHLPCAADVHLNHVLCSFNTATGVYEVVGVMYPSVTLEDSAVGEYLLMLQFAAMSEDGEFFHEECKAQGVNIDILHRWMKANDIKSNLHAQQILSKIGVMLKRDAEVKTEPEVKMAA